MLRTTVAKLKKAYSSLSLAPRVLGGNSKLTLGNFQKSSITSLRKADKSTNTGKNKAECEKCQKLISLIFGPNKPPNTDLPKHDFHPLQDTCPEIMQQYERISQIQARHNNVCPKAYKGDEDHKSMLCNDFIHSTTEKQSEEKFVQKVEKITESAMIEAENTKIERLNAPPRVLGDINSVYNYDSRRFDNFEDITVPTTDDGANKSFKYSDMPSSIVSFARRIEENQRHEYARKKEIRRIEHLSNERADFKLPIHNFSSNRKQPRKSVTSMELEQPYDELAKRCLDASINQIEEYLLKDMGKLGVPQTSTKERTAIEENIIQMDVLKKPRKPINKTEIDLGAREFDRDSPFAFIDKKHPAFQVANNPKAIERNKAAFERDESMYPDHRPPYDPTLSIIDSKDKKTLAYGINKEGYGFSLNQISGQEPVRESDTVNQEPQSESTNTQTKTSRHPSKTSQFMTQSVPRQVTENPTSEVLRFNQNQTKSVEAIPCEKVDVTYSKQPKDMVKTNQRDPNLAMEQISHSFVKPQIMVNPLINRRTLEEPADKIQNNFSTVCSSLPLMKSNEEISLSEMLRRVRLRNRNEYCGNSYGYNTMDPVTGKCRTKKPLCPPPAPTCPPPAPTCPPPLCPPLPCPPPPCPPPPCPPPKCPPPLCPRPCKPAHPPPCPPPKKDPCQKFKRNPGINFNNIITIFLQPESDIKKATSYPILCSSAYGRSCAVLTKGVSVKLQQLGLMTSNSRTTVSLSTNCSAGNVTLARGFEPWVPIPSWPIPKKEKKQPFVCPKESCKVIHPPKLHPPCGKNPSISFPKRRNSFSLIDIFTFSIGN